MTETQHPDYAFKSSNYAQPIRAIDVVKALDIAPPPPMYGNNEA